VTNEILYRKWRPTTFAELAGQEHVATTLTNALATGRVAHAYLFAGPRGTGKTSTGRLLGKALNCTDRQAGEPCNRCESCISYASGRAMDLVELDAASNRGIDEIRSLREKVAFAPGAGEFKVYLIDEVHMLTEAAFNALLKTLEEPPPHVVFILATTESHKVPATIASRCQRFDFRRVPLVAAVGTLERIANAEGIACEPAALELIARSATGSMRDAINLLDQLATSYGNDLGVEQVRAGLGLIGDERAGRLASQALTGDLAGGLETIGSVRDDGLDLRQFQRELVEELRNLLLVKSGIEPAEGVTGERKRELQEVAAEVQTAGLLAALRAFGEADLKQDPNSTLPLDIALAECVLGRASGQAGNQVEATGNQQQATRAPETRSTSSRQPAANSPVPPTSGRPSPPPAARTEPVTSEPAPAMRTTSAEPAMPPEPASSDIATEPPREEVSYAEPAVVPPDLAAVRARLRLIYERAREAQVQVAALINSVCDIIEADESMVTFGFKYPAQADKISEPRYLQVLTGVVSGVLGREVSVRCVLDPNVEAWTQRERANRSPLVRAAQEMGARVLASEPEEQP
jgi:DNA polymerase-3 subunit gamma/tau